MMKYRCPYCLGKDNDVTLLRVGERLECPKCPFEGDVESVREAYAVHRARFGRTRDRLTVDDLRAL